MLVREERHGQELQRSVATRGSRSASSAKAKRYEGAQYEEVVQPEATGNVIPFSFASNETASITSASLSLTDRAILLVQTHAPVGCISLVQRFLLELGSKPPWCADKFSSLRRQQDLSPMSKSRLIKLSKSRIFWARHSRRHGAQ